MAKLALRISSVATWLASSFLALVRMMDCAALLNCLLRQCKAFAGAGLFFTPHSSTRCTQMVCAAPRPVPAPKTPMPQIMCALALLLRHRWMPIRYGLRNIFGDLINNSKKPSVNFRQATEIRVKL